MALLFAAGLFAPHVHAAAASYIDVEAAQRAIAAAHPELADTPITLPGRILTRIANPTLAAGPLEMLHEDGAEGIGRVRLHCTEPSACMPFYVLVHASAEASRVAAPPRRLQRAEEDSGTQSALSSPAAPLVHSGTHATLLIDSGLLHLRLPVTCLGSGPAGAAVRVEALPRGPLYLATVVDGKTLRGTL